MVRAAGILVPSVAGAVVRLGAALVVPCLARSVVLPSVAGTLVPRVAGASDSLRASLFVPSVAGPVVPCRAAGPLWTVLFPSDPGDPGEVNAMTEIPRFLRLCTVPLALVGCVIEEGPPRRLAPDAPSASPSGPAPPSASAPAPTSPSPMLVEVDTDETMTADPGDGVGLFIEYGAGGHWHLWWTCDTARTGQTCDFNVSATASAGSISEVDSSALPGGYVTTPMASRVEARIRTGNEVHGLRFTTSPGAVITLQAAVGAIQDGSFLFFVQNGQVNGGFTGRLTNPLQVQGTTP